MDNKELRTVLTTHLDKLKSNLKVAPMEVLQTKYKKPFDILRQDISDTASAYAKQIALEGIRIHRDYIDEAVPIVQSAIQQSDLLQQLSVAAFHHQSVEEIESLAQKLHDQIQKALEPFYVRHMCLHLSPACFANPPQAPELFNNASGCVWHDGQWKPLPDKEKDMVVFSQEKQSLAA